MGTLSIISCVEGIGSDGDEAEDERGGGLVDWIWLGGCEVLEDRFWFDQGREGALCRPDEVDKDRVRFGGIQVARLLGTGNRAELESFETAADPRSARWNTLVALLDIVRACCGQTASILADDDHFEFELVVVSLELLAKQGLDQDGVVLIAAAMNLEVTCLTDGRVIFLSCPRLGGG